MNRYIDADALIAEIKMDIEDDGLQEKMVFYRINEAPSIDIVRCKECTERDDDWCMYWGNVINPDDFCSYGEREGE